MDVTEHMMEKWDHEDLKSVGPMILTPRGTPAEYRPTLPPVAHDPLNIREPMPDLKSLYPKLGDLVAVEAAVWGKYMPNPIERALRKELAEARAVCTDQLEKLQKLMAEQRNAQELFNRAYADVEHILEKHPELLKP